MDFSTKRVLVTAGANGIGHAIAVKFKELGAEVFVTDINAAAVDNARAEGFHAQVSDVSDEADVQELMRTLQERFGGLDILVNNAGIAGPPAPLSPLRPMTG